MPGGDAQQGKCRAARATTALFPAFDGSFAYANERSELAAGQAQLITDHAGVWVFQIRPAHGVEVGNARRLALAA